jgi:hypothetical protein
LVFTLSFQFRNFILFASVDTSHVAGCAKSGLTPGLVLAQAVAWSRSMYPTRRLLSPLTTVHFPAECFARCPGPNKVPFSCSPLLLVHVRAWDPNQASIATAITGFLAAADSPARNFVLGSFPFCNHQFNLEPSACDHLIFLSCLCLAVELPCNSSSQNPSL